jgi:hypothetical protein
MAKRGSGSAADAKLKKRAKMVDPTVEQKMTRDAIILCYAGGLTKQQFKVKFPLLLFAVVTAAIASMSANHAALVEQGLRHGDLEYSDASYSLLRAANAVTGFSAGREEVTYARPEAAAALVDHAAGLLTRKEASERAGPSVDTFKRWARTLRTILNVADLTTVCRADLTKAVGKMPIAVVGRPSFLTPCEAAIFVGNCLSVAQRGLTVSRGVMAAFGRTVLQKVSETEADPCLKAAYASAACSRTWIANVLKTAADVGASYSFNMLCIPLRQMSGVHAIWRRVQRTNTLAGITTSFIKQHELSVERVRALNPENEVAYREKVMAIFEQRLGPGRFPDADTIWNGDEMGMGRGAFILARLECMPTSAAGRKQVACSALLTLVPPRRPLPINAGRAWGHLLQGRPRRALSLAGL